MACAADMQNCYLIWSSFSKTKAPHILQDLDYDLINYLQNVSILLTQCWSD